MFYNLGARCTFFDLVPLACEDYFPNPMYPKREPRTLCVRIIEILATVISIAMHLIYNITSVAVHL